MPIDLSNFGITPTDERAQDVDQFNQHAQAVLNPEPESPVVPENPTEPEQVITDTMATTATEQNTANGKGEKCCGPKYFDGNKAKYKTWLRMTETYFQVNSTLFPNDALKIDFALSYMNTGRAADWAEHFTDTHTKDGVLTLPEGYT